MSFESYLMSLPLQACRSPKAHQTAYLLLALYTEVAALYRPRNGSLHPEPKVSSPSEPKDSRSVSSFISSTSQTQIMLVIFHHDGGGKTYLNY